MHGNFMAATGGPKNTNTTHGSKDIIETGVRTPSGAIEDRQEFNCTGPKVGPTPAALGKRARDTRSPPSSGSMEGPPSRLFCPCSDSGSHPFDLNTPLTTNTVPAENFYGGVSEQPMSVNIPPPMPSDPPIVHGSGMSSSEAQVSIRPMDNIDAIVKEVESKLRI
ncbi:hypothetical protein Hanom_Chr14g01321711 [Helianthus anomalus]